MTEKFEQLTHSHPTHSCHPEFISGSVTKGRRAAFTLAEVLITLAVIGIVAALTIPALVQNHNEHVWKTAKDLLEKKLVEVTRRMNIDGVMTGYNTTEAYFDTFRKYMKIVKFCDNSNINKCYSPKVITTGKDGEIEIDTSAVKKSMQLGLRSWNTNTVAFVIADGTTVIMAYNPDCETVDPISAEGQKGQVGCMGMVIDVNGKKGPNRVGKDIQLSSGVAFSTCDNPIGDLCFSTWFYPKSINTCDDTTYDESGSANGWCNTNYWAGAKQTCAEKGMRLPTRAELAQLAGTIYGRTIGEKESVKDGLSVQKGYENALIYNHMAYWASDLNDWSTAAAWARSFYSNRTSVAFNYGKSKADNHAICIK